MSHYEYGAKPSKLGVSSLPSGLTPEVIIRFYEALDCPRSLMACLLFRYGEFDQLVGLEVDPSHYLNSESFRDAYSASSFLTKSRFLETSFDRKKLAIDKFLKFEDSCKEVNQRFVSYRSQLNEFTGNGALLSAMRLKIDKILGHFDPSELFDLSSWGPGVSTLIKGEETFGAKKFQCETGITRDLYPLVKDLFPLTYPSWWVLLESNKEFPSFQIGNAVVTVPKTSKIDRVIAIEPGLNLWFQLGLGRMIRRRLGRVGIDLTDQSRNQSLAKRASLSGRLATVDFSSASDSISSELVYNLFSSASHRWFEVMDLIRSKYGIIDSKVFRWNKFSSMGNGFTFDLETLIFYVAAVTCCEAGGVSAREVSVYGDDVIIPSVVYESFCSLCEFLGFSVNRQKSFSSGPFRESCGSHYFMGSDCKPLHLEDALSQPRRVYNFANMLRLWSHNFYGCDGRFRNLFYYLVNSVPKKIRFKVSAIYNRHTGDLQPLEGGFISNLDEAVPHRARHGIEGYLVKRLRWVSIMKEVDYPGLLLDRLSSVSVASMGNACPLRGRTKCSLTTTLIRRWYDLGPWL
jgi:hypothetical protein